MTAVAVVVLILQTILVVCMCVYCVLCMRRGNKELSEEFKEGIFLKAQRLIELESLDRAKQERILVQEKQINEFETLLEAKRLEIEKMKKIIRDDAGRINKLSQENGRLIRKLESAMNEEEEDE